jgi:hypothetical protein
VLVIAGRGCPTLENRSFTKAHLDARLDSAACRFMNLIHLFKNLVRKPHMSIYFS